MLILHSEKLVDSSSLILCSLIVLTFMVDTIAVFLHRNKDRPFLAPSSGLPLPFGFEGKSSCDSEESVPSQEEVTLETVTLVLYSYAIIVFFSKIITHATVARSSYSPVY